MANYNSFPGPFGGLVWGIVGGGDDSDPASDHGGGVRFYSPTDHSPEGVNLEDLPFSMRSVGATQFMQQMFGGTPDPGTPVLMMKSQGSPGGVIIGQMNSLMNPGSGGSGSLLSNNQHFQELKNRKLNVSAPPRIQESTGDDGVQIRKIMETGEQHHLGLLEGLPLNGALFNMTGFRLPELPNVPTALQTNDGMMMLEQLQQMVGQIMSLGQMFAGLAGNQGGGGGGGGFPNGFGSGNPGGSTYVYDANTVMATVEADTANNNPYGGSQFYSANNRLISIQNQVPSEVALAIGNLAKTIQGLEVNNGVSFFTGGVVHQDTYLQNAENLMCQCKSIDDLMNVLSRLQHDTTLFGTEKLEDVYVTVETSYGPMGSVVDFTGNVYVQYDETTMAAMNAFSANASSNTTSPAVGSVPYDYVPSSGSGGSGGIGGGGGDGGGGSGIDVGGLMGMFGKSAGIMQEMMKRLHPQGEKTARQLYQKVNEGQESQQLFEINKKTLNNGDPFEGGNFESIAGTDQFNLQFGP